MSYKDTYKGMKRGQTYPSVDGNPDFTIPAYDPAYDNLSSVWGALKKRAGQKPTDQENEAMGVMNSGPGPFISPNLTSDQAKQFLYGVMHPEAVMPKTAQELQQRRAQVRQDSSPGHRPTTPADDQTVQSLMTGGLPMRPTWHPPMALPPAASRAPSPSFDPAQNSSQMPSWMQQLSKMGLLPSQGGQSPQQAAAQNPPPNASVAAGPDKVVYGPPEPYGPPAPPAAAAPPGWHPPMALPGAREALPPAKPLAPTPPADTPAGPLPSFDKPVPKAVIDKAMAAAQQQQQAAPPSAPKAPYDPMARFKNALEGPPIETDKNASTNTLSSSSGGRRDVKFSPEAFTALYSKYMNTPMVKDQMGGLDQLRELLKVRAAMPAQFDMDPLYRATDWLNNGKTHMAEGYKSPESPQDKLDTILGYAQKLQQDKSAVAKSVMDAARMDKAGYDQNQLLNKQVEMTSKMLQDPRAIYLRGMMPQKPEGYQQAGEKLDTWFGKQVAGERETIETARQALADMQNPDWTRDVTLQAKTAALLKSHPQAQNALMQNYSGNPALAERIPQILEKLFTGQGNFKDEDRQALMDNVKAAHDSSIGSIRAKLDAAKQTPLALDWVPDPDQIEERLKYKLLDAKASQPEASWTVPPTQPQASPGQPSSSAGASGGGTIKVKKDGQTFTMPEANWEKAKARGYERVQ